MNGNGTDRDKPTGGGSIPPQQSSMLVINGDVGAAILTAVAFWVVVILLPEQKPDRIAATVWLVCALLAVVAIAGFLVAFMTRGRTDTNRVTMPGAVTLFAYCLLLSFLILGSNTGFITMAPVLKFALAVGGTALASFVVGLLLFDTIRAAASVPIVVLFIGTATLPAPLPELASIRPTLITWMGVIIGATAVAESATQIARTIQRGRVAQSVVTAAGPAGLENPQGLGASVQEIITSMPGDLQRNPQGAGPS